MWEIQNGKERETSNWASLFQAVDTRLKLTKIIQPRSSKLGIIEAMWDIWALKGTLAYRIDINLVKRVGYSMHFQNWTYL